MMNQHQMAQISRMPVNMQGFSSSTNSKDSNTNIITANIHSNHSSGSSSSKQGEKSAPALSIKKDASAMQKEIFGGYQPKPVE